jgi:tRNA(Ile)-lysidine synthase
MKPDVPPPTLTVGLFHPGLRIAVACSGGADSAALLRTLLERRGELGLVLSVAHVNHGIRGPESDADEAFVGDLAVQFNLPFHVRRVATPAAAAANGEGLEEAARKLRYAWFWELLAANEADAVVTAHTLDDQSETVLHRLIRGAWTEGLSGIHPELKGDARQRGMILRPFLGTTRREIEAWLREIGQPWREDSTNRDTAFTRNRIRHELLPVLAEYNPQIEKQLAQLASLARDEEAYWQGELTRLLPSILLPGRAVRGGGRATDTLGGDRSVSIEIERLRGLHPAMRRRVLRAAAGHLGLSIGFDETERLLALCGLDEGGKVASGRQGGKIDLQRGLRAERTPRELRVFRLESGQSYGEARKVPREYRLSIPGSVEAAEFGLRIEAEAAVSGTALPDACLRGVKPGDRVTLRHTRSPMKIKDALHRARLAGGTAAHPVLEWQGEIVWTPGLELESNAGRSTGLIVRSVQLK